MKSIIIIAFVFTSASLFGQIFVSQTATGSNDGTSWVNAYTDLQDGINALNTDFQEIWVKAGTYSPTRDVSGDSNPTDPRTKRFSILNYIPVIRGGFNGTETASFQANSNLNQTIIDGNIGVQNDSLDNVYSIFYCEVASDFIGLTIQNSNSSGSGASWNSAIHSNSASLIRVMKCTMKNNVSNYRGGAICISNSQGQLFTSDVFFFNNSAAEQGGAVYSEGQMQLTSSRFEKCKSAYGGAAKFIGGFDNRAEYCSFVECNATQKGASIQIFSATVTVSNCSFYGNTSSVGEFSSYDQFGTTYFNINNSIIINSGSVMANVDNGQDGYLFKGCISNLAFPPNSVNCVIDDPLFVNPPSNMSLQSCSPAIENSNAIVFSHLSPPAFDGTYRDLGSVEYFKPVISSTTTELYLANAFPAQPTSWQWINCSNDIPINSETSVNMFPSTSGDYAIVAVFPTCADTSNCVQITVTPAGQEENESDNITIYPNPTTSNISIQLETPTNLLILSSEGKIVATLTGNSSYNFDASNLENGIYFIQTENGAVQKFIKN